MATEKSSIMACTLLEVSNLAALLLPLLLTTEQVLIDVQITDRPTRTTKLYAHICKARQAVMKPLNKTKQNKPPQNDCVMGSLCSIFRIALHLCAATCLCQHGTRPDAILCTKPMVDLPGRQCPTFERTR